MAGDGGDGFSTLYYDTWQQAAAMAIVPKIPAVLSFVGSSCIIREVIEDHRRNEGGAIKRILLAMSVADLCSSAAWFVSTWAIPRDTPGVAFAAGTTQTCTAAGFFLQVGILATPLYSAVLSVAYLLVVRRGCTERDLRRLEPWAHGAVATFTLGTTVAGFPLMLYNNSVLVCWIAEHPLGCQQSYEYGAAEADCVRGDNATIYSFAFSIAPLWTGMFIVGTSMILLVSSVRGIEKKSALWARRSTNESTRLKKTYQMGVQACCYIAAYFLTYIPDTVSVILLNFFDIVSFWFDIVAYALNPLQGFMNFLIFARRRRTMHGVVGRTIQRVVFKSWCCPCSGCRDLSSHMRGMSGIHRSGLATALRRSTLFGRSFFPARSSQGGLPPDHVAVVGDAVDHECMPNKEGKTDFAFSEQTKKSSCITKTKTTSSYITAADTVHHTSMPKNEGKEDSAAFSIEERGSSCIAVSDVIAHASMPNVEGREDDAAYSAEARQSSCAVVVDAVDHASSQNFEDKEDNVAYGVE